MNVIYCCKNKIDNKMYIGQTKNIENRIKQHYGSAHRNSEFHIHRAIRKYGWNNFDFSILESNLEESALNTKEEYWINKFDTFNNGYNMTMDGTVSRRGLNLSEEHKEKIRKKLLNRTFSEKTLKKMSMAQMGKKHPHTKAAKKKIKKGTLGRVVTAEGRKNISNAKKEYWKINKDKHPKTNKKWKINDEIINDLGTWCRLHKINYSSFLYYKNKNIFYKGFCLQSIEE